MNDRMRLEIPEGEKLDVTHYDGTPENNITKIITSTATIKNEKISRSFKMYKVSKSGKLKFIKQSDYPYFDDENDKSGKDDKGDK